jgi:hypothetical protein
MKTKQIQWKNILFTTIFWLTTEIFLNIVGLDSLADYGEFVLERDTQAPRLEALGYTTETPLRGLRSIGL